MSKFLALYGANQNKDGYSEEVMTVIREAPVALGMVNSDREFGVTQTNVLNWWNDAIVPTQTAINNVGGYLAGAAILVVDSDVGFAAGSVIRFDGSEELAIVTSVAPANTLNVTRGAFGTTAQALGDNQPVYLVSQGVAEGGAAPAFTSATAGNQQNYFQTFSHELQISAEALATYTYGVGAKEGKWADEFRKGSADLRFQVARQFLYGKKQLGTSTVNSHFTGLLELTKEANASAFVDLAAAAMSENVLNDAVRRIQQRGGVPDTIILHPSKIRPLAQAAANRVQTLRSETILGVEVLMLQSENGPMLGILQDYTIDASHVWVGSWGEVGLSYREPWTLEDLAKTGNAEKKLLRAQVSLVARNMGNKAEWLYNLG